jgi:beta-RFAP synthase
MQREVIVTAPSRLHFGLFALEAPAGATGERSYGGVGVMIEQPAIELHLRAADGFQVVGDLAERARSFAARWAEFYAQSLDGLQLEIVNTPPDHVGLGTGTQLGLAVAAGLATFHGLPVPPAEELARSVGRGLRSAIGAYGFTLGGLIVDRGKLPDEFLSPLDCRLEVPDAWRFVLVRPAQAAGLSGEPEIQAIKHANRDLSSLTKRLVAEARDSLIPAVATANFAAFEKSLGRYCELAGQFYTEIQGGPYNGPLVTALAARIRALGHAGLGQSSWGPTLFVACEHEQSAQQLAAELKRLGESDLQITITRARNQPASIEVA